MRAEAAFAAAEGEGEAEGQNSWGFAAAGGGDGVIVLVGEIGEGGGRGVEDLLVRGCGDDQTGFGGEVFGQIAGYAVEEIGGCAVGREGEGDGALVGDAWEGLNEDVGGRHSVVEYKSQAESSRMAGYEIGSTRPQYQERVVVVVNKDNCWNLGLRCASQIAKSRFQKTPEIYVIPVTLIKSEAVLDSAQCLFGPRSSTETDIEQVAKHYETSWSS